VVVLAREEIGGGGTTRPNPLPASRRNRKEKRGRPLPPLDWKRKVQCWGGGAGLPFLPPRAGKERKVKVRVLVREGRKSFPGEGGQSEGNVLVLRMGGREEMRPLPFNQQQKKREILISDGLEGERGTALPPPESWGKHRYILPSFLERDKREEVIGVGFLQQKGRRGKGLSFY